MPLQDLAMILDQAGKMILAGLFGQGKGSEEKHVAGQ